VSYDSVFIHGISLPGQESSYEELVLQQTVRQLCFLRKNLVSSAYSHNRKDTSSISRNSAYW